MFTKYSGYLHKVYIYFSSLALVIINTYYYEYSFNYLINIIKTHMMDYKLTKLHDRKTLIKKNNIKFIKELIVN